MICSIGYLNQDHKKILIL